ncbi:MAG: hypothetical protein ACK4N5_16730, partial [Myxococcales bacterium]
CALVGGAGGIGGGGVQGPPIGPDTSGNQAPFNNQPLAKSIVYGRTKAGNFHYRFFDRTTGAACVLEGIRGDVYVEYPTREQYLLTATEAQAPETFAQPAALALVQGGTDMRLSLVTAPVGGLRPGGAADQGAGGVIDLVAGVAQGFFGRVTRLLGRAGGPVGAPGRVKVVETFIRDGDLRCVLLMHSAIVEDTTRIAFKGSSGAAAPSSPSPAPAPAAQPAAPGKK